MLSRTCQNSTVPGAGLDVMRSLVDAAAAGALGGACLGFAEAALVAATSAPADEYWLFPFAVVAYGLLGAAIGSGLAVVYRAARRGSVAGGGLASWAAAVAIGPLLFVVGRYHVTQRLLAEQPLLSSPSGWITAAFLLAATAFAAWAGLLFVRACHRVAGRWGPPAATTVLAAAALLLGIALGPPVADPPQRRDAPPGTAGKPNVILIVADTLRADAAQQSAAGARSGLGRLAADGVVFERAYAHASWTRPSVASILTSQYPSIHGAVGKTDVLPDAALTLAEVLRAEGYWTAGVTTNSNVAPRFNFQQGFDEFVYLQPRYHLWATDSATRLAICKGFYKALRVAYRRLTMPMRVEYYYRDATTVNRSVREWLDSHPPEPFFLFIHYMDPHDPYFEMPYNGRGVARTVLPDPPPERRRALHELYLQDVRYLDEHVHLLLEQLRARGLYDRSVVALTADHGEEFYEHRGWWHGTTLYDEQLHVPLLIKRAPEPLRGTRRTDPVRSVDIAPALLAAAGLSAPAAFMGADLHTAPIAEPLFAEEDLEGNRLHSVRSAGWKLITANPRNPRHLDTVELYQLDADPGETRNLAAAEPARAAELLAQLKQIQDRLAEHSADRPRLAANARDAGAGP